MTVLWPSGSTQIPTVTSEFGMRFHPIDAVWRLHSGIDLIGWSIIKSPVDGQVVTASYQGSYGNLVVVRGNNGDRFYMAHNRELWVRVGQWVKQGQDLAVMGTTGASTGVHCHYETRPGGGAPVNPRNYMAEANAAPAGGGGTPVPKPTPVPEEEDDMAKNSGVYYENGKNTWVYLVFNTDSGWFHEFGNGAGNGPMPADYNNALARALDTPSWAKVTKSHADVIKRGLAVVNDRDVSGEVKVEIEPASVPAQ